MGLHLAHGLDHVPVVVGQEEHAARLARAGQLSERQIACMQLAVCMLAGNHCPAMVRCDSHLHLGFRVWCCLPSKT